MFLMGLLFQSGSCYESEMLLIRFGDLLRACIDGEWFLQSWAWMCACCGLEMCWACVGDFLIGLYKHADHARVRFVRASQVQFVSI